MSSAGKTLRMGRITNRQNGKIFLVTFDHGICLGPIPGGEDVRAIIRKLDAGKPDCIMVTPGIARASADIFAAGTPVVARIDLTATVLGPDITNDNLLSSVEAALRLGADGVGLFSVLGCDRESQLFTKTGQVADECDRWAIPLLLELLPPERLEYQFRASTKREWPATSENVKFCARLAAKQGADIVKSFCTGEKRSFEKVVHTTPILVLVLSGSWANYPETLFSFVRDAIRVGAAGVSTGRNICQHQHPTQVIKALGGVIHRNWTASQATEYIDTATRAIG